MVILCISLTFSCTVCAQTSPVLVFEHANVIDGLSVEPLRDVTVVVRDAKIERVGSAPPSLPDSAQHIDITGHWMLPGLIDAHVHPFTLQGAQNMLKAGVTTGRSMFTLHYMDVGLRELHRRGDADIPDILAAGYPVVPIPTQFRPDITGMFLGIAISNGFSLVRDDCGDVNKRLHIGIAGSSRGNYSTAVGVSRQYDWTLFLEKHRLQYGHIISEQGQRDLSSHDLKAFSLQLSGHFVPTRTVRPGGVREDYGCTCLSARHDSLFLSFPLFSGKGFCT